MNISLSAFAPDKLVSRDGFGSPVQRQPAHLHTQAESGAYLRDSSRVSRRRPCGEEIKNCRKMWKEHHQLLCSLYTVFDTKRGRRAEPAHPPMSLKGSRQPKSDICYPGTFQGPVLVG